MKPKSAGSLRRSKCISCDGDIFKPDKCGICIECQYKEYERLTGKDGRKSNVADIQGDETRSTVLSETP